MSEFCIQLSDDFREELVRHPEIEWSKVFERAVREELEERTRRRVVFLALNKLLENSEVTGKDALKLGDKVNEGMLKRLREEGLP